MTMPRASLAIALVTEVFVGNDAKSRLQQRLHEAREAGADLAVLPELPLNSWAPATKQARDRDAEPPGGERETVQAEAARRAGIALLGGVIRRDTDSGARHNTSLLFDDRGRVVTAYRKIHLPDEKGFWEAHHYQPGDDLPRVVEIAGFRLGLQICSDVNRPALSQVLAARGAEIVIAPRATPLASYERWKLVLRANAITACAFVVSTNRPANEAGVDVGGPSIAIAPDGGVLLESEGPMQCTTLERTTLEEARRDYPGYLDVRADLYARAWSEIADLSRQSCD